MRQSDVSEGDNFGELGQGGFTALMQNVLNEVIHSGINEGGNDNESQTKSDFNESSDKNDGIGGNKEVGIGDTVQHEGIEDGGSDTDYPHSSDYDSPESSIEDRGIRMKPLFPIYNLKTMMSKLNHVLGMRFGSPKEFK
ncbi:hypothetical protein LguiB_029955 [Lonicera macranthoides]